MLQPVYQEADYWLFEYDGFLAGFFECCFNPTQGVITSLRHSYHLDHWQGFGGMHVVDSDEFSRILKAVSHFIKRKKAGRYYWLVSVCLRTSAQDVQTVLP